MYHSDLLLVGEYLMLFFGKSDVGKVRAVNEDSFTTVEFCKNLLLCIICDGMGGYESGEIASELAIMSFTDYIRNHLSPYINTAENMFDFGSALNGGIEIYDVLCKAVSAANTTIRQRGSHDRKLKDMGTTLVAALIINSMLYIANVGDSRLYMIDNNEMKQLTHDHSLVQHLIDSGQITPEEALKHRYRSVLTRVVGLDTFTETDTDIFKFDFKSGYILMCSDGLYNYFTPEQYNEVLKDADDIDKLTSAVEKLVDNANANGGKDNITVIVIKSPDLV